MQRFRTPFFQNVATVAGGTAAAQAILIAFTPLITRLYGPQAFGLQGLFLTIVALGSTFAALSYPMAIVLPKSERDAIGLVRLSLTIGVVVTLATCVLAAVFGEKILVFLNASELTKFIYLVPVAMFVAVCNETATQYSIRTKAFKLIAGVSAASSLISNTLKAGFGFVVPTAGVLIATNILGHAIKVFLLLKGQLKNRTASSVPIKSVGNDAMWTLARRHSDFAQYRAPQNLINALSAGLPVVLLAKYYGAPAAGFYSLAVMALAVPANLIGSSVLQVFYPQVNEAIQRGQPSKHLIIRTTLGLVLIGILPLLVIVVGGPWLFSFVFGAQWDQSGVYAQWLSVWLFFQYVNKPAVAAIPSLMLHRGLLIYELFSTSSKVLALYIGFAVYESDVVGIALFSIAGVVAYVWLISWVIVHADRSHKNSQLGRQP